ncbi:MAG TPA: LLM class flavin-dependent oxidoreductase [Candidatus Dormibacteraeota bacterium]
MAGGNTVEARSRPGVALPGSTTPTEARALAAAAEAAGAEAVWVLDVRREPYLVSMAALEATTQVEVGVNVAVAFARSPALTATAAWDLAGASGGRFVLGLGSQVGGTLEARFAVSADHPAPRLRDYVGAVRACFDAYEHGRGYYEGDFYRLRLPVFQPGADRDHPRPPVYVAAVNPVMTRVAGAVADGLAAHPFTTLRYVKEVIRPELAAGASSADREPPLLLLQLVVAPDRESAVKQMTAYCVPAYRRVLDHAGLGEVADAIFAANARGDRAQARELVDREVVDQLGVIVAGSAAELKASLEPWHSVADRLSLSVPWYGLEHESQVAAYRGLLELLPAI